MALTLHGTVSDNTVALDRKTVPPIFINGDMGIWQRGASLSSSSGTYACDRFWYAGTGATSQRSTDVPSGFIYSNKLTYGSADMSIGQPIELPATGKQGIFIAGQTVTIAFYGKVDSGTEGISVSINARNEKFSGTNSTAFTISDSAVTLTTDWQRFTKTFTIPTINANNIMLAFELGGISKTAYFTGFQCELGTYDTNSIADFQFEDVGTSLARCQRYYYKAITGTSFNQLAFCNVRTTTSHYALMQMPVTLRANPTSVDFGAIGIIASWGAAVVGLSSLTFANAAYGPGTTQVLLDAVTGSAVGTVGNVSILLGANSATGFIGIDSEL